MILASRLLALCCVALLVTGAAGAVGISPRATTAPRSVPATATTSPTTTVPASDPGAATPVVAPAASAALAAGLIQPEDMGGYYHPSGAALDGLVGADACLAALLPSPTQAGRAAEGLTTGDRFEVPQIVEVVASYPGAAPQGVYDATKAAIGACSHFAFHFDGAAVAGDLAPQPLATSATAATAWAVPFQYQGVAFTLQMALVRQGQNVMFLAWADTASPSPAIMGGFASTVTAAIGKEA